MIVKNIELNKLISKNRITKCRVFSIMIHQLMMSRYEKNPIHLLNLRKAYYISSSSSS